MSIFSCREAEAVYGLDDVVVRVGVPAPVVPAHPQDLRPLGGRVVAAAERVEVAAPELRLAPRRQTAEVLADADDLLVAEVGVFRHCSKDPSHDACCVHRDSSYPGVCR